MPDVSLAEKERKKNPLESTRSLKQNAARKKSLFFFLRRVIFKSSTFPLSPSSNSSSFQPPEQIPPAVTQETDSQTGETKGEFFFFHFLVSFLSAAVVTELQRGGV